VGESFKFIHASDFHLDQPMRGLAEIPGHLIEVLANAPYLAAQKIFDLAISERVDFVLLSGDLYDSELGHARAAAFLLNQFQKLREKGIAVYWAGGEVDHPDRWPGAIELPENVVTFSTALVEQIEHRRDGIRIARIIGGGYDARRASAQDFAAADNETINIGMAYGEFEKDSMAGTRVRYWAMGGNHKASKVENADTVIAYPGSPQGRHPKESGAHGFNFCRVDTSGKIRIQFVESDRIRWTTQKLTINEQVKLSELKKELGERATKTIADTTEQTILCKWQFSTEGDFNPELRSREWKTDLLKWLRDEFGRSERGLWSVSVSVEAPKNLPLTWYEEDTILGEYLRATGRYQSDASLRINFHDYLPTSVEGSLAQGLGVIGELHRDEVLRRAALMGIEYLAKHKEFIDTVES
jgi:DNA repair exonuclease SbcCD nuclease subunit